MRESYDPTYEKLSLIDTNAKYILAIIIMHGGEIDSYLLHEIVKLSSAEVLVFDYDKQINKLFEYDIIEQNGIYYSLIHATMNDAWHNHKKELNRFNLLAYKNCCTYYTNILERNFGNINNVEEALLFLIKVYSEYDPEKIVTVIDKMNSIVSERIRPEKIFQYFLIFLDYVKDNKSEYSLALYKMMFFCFNHGLFEQCLYIIQQLRSIESEKQKFILLVYEINCFEYLELHKKSISLCEEYLCCENDNHKKYIFYLLLMGCYRSLNKMDKVNMCVEAIQALPDFTEKYEYGIFLRLSEIYMKRAEALPYVKKSVQFYKGKNEFLENKSRITYSFLLAVTDDLDKAEEQLNICIESDKATHYWDSILCLNKASILILREKYGNEVDSLLKKAELSTNSNFDLLLILTLQLINNYEIKNNSLNNYVLTRIVRLLDQESDKHLIALVSYDLYLYYTKIQEHDLAKEYYQVAQETCQYNSTVKFHLNHKKNPNTPNLFRIDWCIGFTFFWNVDYEDISV